VTGTIGDEKNTVVRFPDCPFLETLKLGRFHGSSPFLLVRHVLASAARSLQLQFISLTDGFLDSDELQMLFHELVMPEVRYLNVPLWKSDALQKSMLFQITEALPNLRYLCIPPSLCLAEECTEEEITAMEAYGSATALNWLARRHEAIPDTLRAQIAVRYSLELW
jgi:hypothetical protein